MFSAKIQSLLALLALVALASFGCDESQATAGRQGDPGQNNKTTLDPPTSNVVVGDSNVQGGEQFVGEVFAEPAPAPEMPEQGEDDTAMIQQPGPFNGSWRVVVDDATGQEVLRFSLNQGQDPEATTGSYIMSEGMGQGFSGQVGEFSKAMSASDTLTLNFNPTNDDSDLWSLTTSERLDTDRLKGVVSNVDGSLRKEVVLLRETPEENSGIRTPEG